jgi:hypothetical protein
MICKNPVVPVLADMSQMLEPFKRGDFNNSIGPQLPVL